MNADIITILIVGIIVIAGIVVAIIVGKRQSRKQHAYSIITGQANYSPKANNDDKKAAQQRADLAQKLKDAGEKEKKEKKKHQGSLKFLIQQAGFQTSVLRFFVNSFLFTCVVSGLLSLTAFGLLPKILLTFFAFLGMPRIFLKFKIKRREKKFLTGFADALDAMVRMLQAGMPVGEAVAMVSKEFDGPLGVEMSHIYNDQKVGIPMGEAANRAAERMPITEMQMFATAIQIQSETGSSLSEVLSNLATVIRARFRLQRKVKALSSEAKASAAIIGCLPLLVAGGLYLVNPDYIMKLFTIPKGKVMITGAALWMSVGVFIMKQMINFRV